VTLKARVQTPAGTGQIVATEWDFEGDGTYTAGAVERPKATLTVQQTHQFDTPGVYFVAVKVTSQRDGVDNVFTKVQNLDRVRVVVHARS
jgi:hypothetical protein